MFATKYRLKAWWKMESWFVEVAGGRSFFSFSSFDLYFLHSIIYTRSTFFNTHPSPDPKLSEYSPTREWWDQAWLLSQGVPGGHTEVQSIQEEPSCSFVGADWLERFWPVTGGEMMLVSEPWGHGKIYRLIVPPTEHIWCSAAAVPITEGDTYGWCRSTPSTQVPLETASWVKRTMTSCCSDRFWGNDSRTRRWGSQELPSLGDQA